MRLLPAVAVAVVATSLACRSDAEKLVDLRTELRTRMDALYAAYAGGATAAQADAPAQRGGDARASLPDPARIVGELERSYFEGSCLARGRGERPLVLSGKLDAFLKDPGNERACREAAKLELRVEELESKVTQKP